MQVGDALTACLECWLLTSAQRPGPVGKELTTELQPLQPGRGPAASPVGLLRSRAGRVAGRGCTMLSPSPEAMVGF